MAVINFHPFLTLCINFNVCCFISLFLTLCGLYNYSVYSIYTNIIIFLYVGGAY